MSPRSTKPSATSAVRDLKAATKRALAASARLKDAMQRLERGDLSAEEKAEMLTLAAEVDASNRAVKAALRSAKTAVDSPSRLK